MSDGISRRRFLRESALVASVTALGACDPRRFPRDGGMRSGDAGGDFDAGGGIDAGGVGPGAGTDAAIAMDARGGTDAAGASGDAGVDAGAGMVPGGALASGPFAQPIYGDAGGIVRWERLGGDCYIELQIDGVFVVTPRDTPRLIDVLSFELGEGHEDIVAHFGAATLAELRRELAFPTVVTRA